MFHGFNQTANRIVRRINQPFLLFRCSDCDQVEGETKMLFPSSPSLPLRLLFQGPGSHQKKKLSDWVERQG